MTEHPMFCTFFLGEERFDMQTLFGDERFPNIVVTMKGIRGRGTETRPSSL